MTRGVEMRERERDVHEGGTKEGRRDKKTCTELLRERRDKWRGKG